MSGVDLTKAKKLVVASDAQSANKLIDKGWTLFDSASGRDETGYPITKYSLAWLHDTEPQQYP